MTLADMCILDSRE